MAVDSSQAATALLTEHLQYTPLSLIDDIIDSVNNFIYQGVGSLETGLFSTPPERLGFKSNKSREESSDGTDAGNVEAKQEIEEGLHKLETLLNSTVDKNFDKFEIYVLRNILSVPVDLANWIRLGHYTGITYPPPENAPTPDDISLLRRKVAASRNVARALAAEHAQNEKILSQLRALTAQASESTNKPNLSFMSDTNVRHGFNGRQPLTTNATFTLSQLPALKSVLMDLRAKLTTLKDTPLSTDTAKDERREQRRGYIEERIRKHVERSGETADSASGPLPGKQVEPSEVQALEMLAATFKAP